MLSNVVFSTLLSRASDNVAKTLELQLYTSKKVWELTANVETMSALASEALKSSTQVAKILQLITTFNDTAGSMKSLSDNLGVLLIGSQGSSLHVGSAPRN